MPNHLGHDTATTVVSVVAAPGIAIAVDQLGGSPMVVGAAAVTFLLGGLAGLFLTPDLDVDQGCYSFYRMRQVNYTLGLVWEAYWKPYGRLAKHRGVSHLPIIGTLGRVLYGLPWLIPVILLSLIWAPFWFWWLLGLMWSDFWHLVLDTVV